MDPAARKLVAVQPPPDSTRTSRFGRRRDRLPSWIRRLHPPRWSRSLIASMNAFAGCSPRQIYRIARWGDVIEAQPGDVLIREDRTDWWFYVILAGSVQLTHEGREIATLRRGNHFGEVAIVGFRPQPATITVIEPTVMLVLNRRYLLSLVALDPAIQRALFPNVAGHEYSAFVRDLMDKGRLEWERLKPRYVTGKGGSTLRGRPGGRELGWDEALDLLSHHDIHTRRTEAVMASLPESAKRPSVVVAAALAALVGGFTFFYHPPMAVITAGQPIDVVRDISITGTVVDATNGKYLMTLANIERPSVFGVILAKMRGRLVVQARSSATDALDPQTEQRLGRQAFLDSHRQAIALAEKILGIDADGLTVVIRDRGVAGPSAGLIYALALVDMLDSGDLAAGRTIAATGELASDGKVERVAFISIKAGGALNAGATLFIVPKGQEKDAGRGGLAVLGVNDLEAAVRLLNPELVE